MEIMETQKTQKNPNIFSCNYCNFNTRHKNDFNKHLLTGKHIKMCSGNKMEINGNKKPKKTQKNPKLFICSFCNKSYNSNSGLWKHKNNCNNNCKDDNIKKDIQYENNISDKELIMMLVKQNSELLEVIKNGTHNNNNNTTNSHNKTFNLQFFLNETCKDAMNIMDFVDSIKLQLTDLEKVGKIGYVEGISNIIVKNLNSLDETKRPVHCTDAKREVMYVKDEDKWEKENENKQKIRKAIKHVAHKNSKLLNDFKKKHPDCDKSDSKFSDQYNKIIIEAMGGKGDNDLEKEDKIIKNIVKEVIIDKHNELD
jgi:hypothetical protein